MSSGPGIPEAPKGQGRQFNYVGLVAIVFVLIGAVAVINMLRTDESGTLGIGDYGQGEPVPKFAVPIADGGLEGDANVNQDQACDIDVDEAIRICDYFDRPLVMSFWFTKGASECIGHQDAFDEAAARFGDRAGFVSINVRDDRDRVRELISQHDWQVPVGYDRDGAVSNIYRVGGCPTFAYVKTGGVLKNAEIGTKAVEQLDSQIRSLLKSDGEEVEPAEAES